MPALSFFLSAVCGFAGPTPEELAYRMQRAVLGTQDLAEIQQILKLGFDVNAPIGCGTFSSVNGAVHVGNVAMLQLLLKAGARPRSLDDAAFHANPETAYAMTKALLEAGADANRKIYYMNDPVKHPVPMSTPLHRAAWRGNLKVVELLLQEPGVEVDVMNMDGSTALMSAVAKENDDVVRVLLDHGANPKLQNNKGRSAIDVAQDAIRKREATLRMLSDAPAPARKEGAGLTSTAQP